MLKYSSSSATFRLYDLMIASLWIFIQTRSENTTKAPLRTETFWDTSYVRQQLRIPWELIQHMVEEQILLGMSSVLNGHFYLFLNLVTLGTNRRPVSIDQASKQAYRKAASSTSSFFCPTYLSLLQILFFTFHPSYRCCPNLEYVTTHDSQKWFHVLSELRRAL